MDVSALLEAAQRASTRAYAPYSKLRVGCVIETADGELFAGCNVENASYGLTICAERAAICAAVAAGARSFRRIGLYSSAKRLITPCGACRQVLAELAPKAQIWMTCANGEKRRRSVSQLLPDQFSKDGWK